MKTLKLLNLNQSVFDCCRREDEVDWVQEVNYKNVTSSCIDTLRLASKSSSTIKEHGMICTCVNILYWNHKQNPPRQKLFWYHAVILWCFSLWLWLISFDLWHFERDWTLFVLCIIFVPKCDMLSELKTYYFRRVGGQLLRIFIHIKFTVCRQCSCCVFVRAK